MWPQVNIPFVHSKFIFQFFSSQLCILVRTKDIEAEYGITAQNGYDDCGKLVIVHQTVVVDN